MNRIKTLSVTALLTLFLLSSVFTLQDRLGLSYPIVWVLTALGGTGVGVIANQLTGRKTDE